MVGDENDGVAVWYSLKGKYVECVLNITMHHLMTLAMNYRYFESQGLL